MFDLSVICDCGEVVKDGLFPCKFCGRPDPANCINRSKLIGVEMAYSPPSEYLDFSFVRVPADRSKK